MMRPSRKPAVVYRVKRFAFIACAALLASSLQAQEKAAKAELVSENGRTEWIQESAVKNLTIHSRLREGSELKEFKGVGVIEASPAAVFAVIDDSEAYPSFMPYTSEVRVIKREKSSVLAYQRLDLPVVSDRDYTLHSRHDTWLGPDGPIYRIRWEPANDLGPAEKPGVLRVNLCEGGWLLEPLGDGSTRATYSIYTDSGGALPPMLANSGGRMGIRKVFDAIRKQVKHPKYTTGATVEARNRKER